MLEEILTTARYNAKVDPLLGIWTWEVAVYLFLGGMTAGILLFSAYAHLAGKDKELPFTAKQLPLWAPIVLSIGMTTLFLDLEHKLYVYRFYTTLQVSSPMSWGSWILMLVYPVSILLILATLRSGYPQLSNWLQRLPLLPKLLTPLFDWSEKHLRTIAWWAVPIAVSLGIYTGILLSTFSARPFWNTSILGPLFLVSGLSAAAALIVISARTAEEKHRFVRIDMLLILVELLLVGLLITGLATGGQVQLDALALILHGDYRWLFWGLFVFAGLIAPLLLELLHRPRHSLLVILAPLLVLFGGYMLRHVTLELGQASSWQQYEMPFDAQLLQRLHES
ncbi:MAG: polysulfide reductase NrfD [Chromatiales bacterium]|jgi:formate-dependent nitrite reductase membrane component NrfD